MYDVKLHCFIFLKSFIESFNKWPPELSSYEQISVLKSLQQLETFPDFELDSHPSQQRSGGGQRIDISKAEIYRNYLSGFLNWSFRKVLRRDGSGLVFMSHFVPTCYHQCVTWQRNNFYIDNTANQFRHVTQAIFSIWGAAFWSQFWEKITSFTLHFRQMLVVDVTLKN